MAGLKRESRLRAYVPAIHVCARQGSKTWMPGTRPGMTAMNFRKIAYWSYPLPFYMIHIISY